MNDLEKRYEIKFNDPLSKVRVSNTWDRYNNVKSINYQRLKYSISFLYGNILDVGSADGFGAFLMTANKKIKNITCIEVQDKALQLSRDKLKGIDNIKIFKAMAESMGFIDSNFDSVFCGQTLEHVFDDKKAIKEIHRVVKDIVVFSVPIKGGISLQHVREYKSEEEFKMLLSNYFTFIEQKYFKEKNINRIVLTCKKK